MQHQPKCLFFLSFLICNFQAVHAQTEYFLVILLASFVSFVAFMHMLGAVLAELNIVSAFVIFPQVFLLEMLAFLLTANLVTGKSMPVEKGSILIKVQHSTQQHKDSKVPW